MKRTLTSEREFRCRDFRIASSFSFFLFSLPPSPDYNELPVDVARGRVPEEEIYVGEKMKSTGRRETTYALSRALLSFILVPLCIRPLSHGWYAPPASPKSSFSSYPEILLIFPPSHPPPPPPSLLSSLPAKSALLSNFFCSETCRYDHRFLPFFPSQRNGGKHTFNLIAPTWKSNFYESSFV